MNFLAHAYLSFNYPEILVGNMISDFVKGKTKFDFSTGIRHGIMLHRQIDAFTDNHETTREAKKFLKPAAGLYAGAFVDVAYDHFLANDPNQFTDASLQLLALNTYQVLNSYNTILPGRFRQMLPYMQAQNWLYNYRNIEGAKKSFGGVASRAVYLSSSAEIFDLFQQHYASLQNCYNAFFPDLKSFSINQLQQLAYK